MNKITVRSVHIIPSLLIPTPDISQLRDTLDSQLILFSGMKGPTSFQASYFDRHLPFTYTQTPNGNYRIRWDATLLIEYKCFRVLQLPVLKQSSKSWEPNSDGVKTEQEERPAEAKLVQVRRQLLDSNFSSS